MFSKSHRKLCSLAVVAIFICSVYGDPNDWVNPAYVLGPTKDASTQSSKSTIVRGAQSTSREGPFSMVPHLSPLEAMTDDTVAVSTTKSVRAPSNNPRDYLSWAPYHWPDCNWCGKGGRNHLATGSNSTDSDDTDGSYDDPAGGDSNNPMDGGPEDGGASDEDAGTESGGDDTDNGGPSSSGGGRLLPLPSQPIHRRHHMRIQRDVLDEFTSGSTAVLASGLPDIVSPLSDEPAPSTTGRVISGTPKPAEHGAKTQKNKHPTPTSKENCTPSPTKSLAPNATWTTCPYVTRDGKVNPDVRQLHGINAINSVTQSSINNALAYAFTQTSSYSRNTASFIEAFFLDAQVGVNPNLNFGQLIRGPGRDFGQFTGILDFRGIVKVVNAIQILKAARSPDWTGALDAKMVTWVNQYVKWLQTNALGQKAAASPNNHGTFCTNQVAALYIYVGDTKTASAALTSYFKRQFLDQIAASGEQPFEAVRTRPFHYRCFNLEAMITNAKLGDQIGLNLWTAKSKYGSTIQTAVDFLIKQNPGSEDAAEALPHVAAVAAAYGDPSGKYAAFLQRTSSAYNSASFFYYDQTPALSNSPAAMKNRAGKRSVGTGNDSDEPDDSGSGNLNGAPSALDDAVPDIPWECPAIFATEDKVQLDDGVFVTCDQLKAFYGYVDDM